MTPGGQERSDRGKFTGPRHHPRGQPARRTTDRGPDPVVRQARTAGGRRRHRCARSRGDRVRVAIEGARTRRRCRTGGRTTPLPRVTRRRVLCAGRRPWRCGPSNRRRNGFDRIRGIGRRWAQPRQRRTFHRGVDGPDRRRRPHRARGRCDGRDHHRHRVGLPIRRADRPQPGARHRRGRRGGRRRPNRRRRHDRHDDAASRHRPDRTACASRRRPADGRALPQHQRRGAGQRVRRRQRRCQEVGRLRRWTRWLPVRAGRHWQHRHRGPRLPPARQRHRSRTSTCRRPSGPRASHARSLATTCRARCSAPATASWAEPCRPSHSPRRAVKRACWPVPSCATSSRPSARSCTSRLARGHGVRRLGGDGILEHVPAEHRHHGRRRPTGRGPAAVRHPPERVPALQHRHRAGIGSARQGTGGAASISTPNTLRSPSHCSSSDSPRSTSASTPPGWV